MCIIALFHVVQAPSLHAEERRSILPDAEDEIVEELPQEVPAAADSEQEGAPLPPPLPTRENALNSLLHQLREEDDASGEADAGEIEGEGELTPTQLKVMEAHLKKFVATTKESIKEGKATLKRAETLRKQLVASKAPPAARQKLAATTRLIDVYYTKLDFVDREAQKNLALVVKCQRTDIADCDKLRQIYSKLKQKIKELRETRREVTAATKELGKA